MNKLFEVPYNFDDALIPFYTRYSSNISFLFLPPYWEDSDNTRTYFQTEVKGCCYMPASREEYESHIKKIIKSGLRYLVLWQEPQRVITCEMLDYYSNLGVAGFTIANDENAKIIKTYNSNLVVIGSVVQRLCSSIFLKDFSLYDGIVLFFPFNRSLDVLKRLEHIKEKLIIMPNTLCHTECPAMHHWFPDREHPFNQNTDCRTIQDISGSAFISPEHLNLFENYVGGFKIQGREYTTELVMYICETYFNRESPDILLRGMLGKKLSEDLINNLKSSRIYDYYNTKTPYIERQNSER